MIEMEKKDELQRKYIEMKMIEQQILNVQNHLKIMEQQMGELIVTIEGLEDFSSVKDGSEILLPLSSGIFTKAVLKKESKLLINVGADVVVEKDAEGTADLLRKQLEELKEAQEDLVNQLQQIVNYASNLEQEIGKLAEELK
ncbi:prefoldin subunit alpha [Candidatus Woesearchaeota archaeon]|nr:prefoldin subunit alpha [Candidatus Woesearchaeota archaeon]